MKLSKVVLPTLKAGITTPSYDPAQLTPGILQVGVGNFFRSHFCAYMDDVLNADADQAGWGIVGSSVQASGNSKRGVLESQDFLQSLVERDGTSAKASVLGSMVDFLTLDSSKKNPGQDVQDMLMNPSIKIVSLTVTEGGYYLSDGAFDTKNKDVQHDAKNIDAPKTIFGMIAKSLKERKESGMKPFTVMCCDNIPHNGEVVQGVVSGICKLMYGDDFAKWVNNEVCFPNSMVDRITPGTTDEMREFVKKEYGYEDSSPVFCEPFRQWVLEDKFSQGRPDWHKLESVSFVDDVAPYELMKIRILNGGHATLSYPSALLDLEYVHDAMEHPVLGPFLDALERTEIIPTVPPVPNTVLTEYWESIAERFSNPTIQDTIDRNCFDGASRQPKFIVPVAVDAIKNKGKFDGLALVSAFWCRYCQGKTDSGKVITDNDPQWDRLQKTALKAANGDPSAWLAMTDVYGKLGENKDFSAAFAKALDTVQTKGVEAAMSEYTAASS